MITAADIDLLVTFDSVNKVFIGIDNTDYTGLGEPTAGLYGLLASTSPVGTLLNLPDYTAPWIDLNGGGLVSANAALPIDTNLGNALFGEYQFIYTVQRVYSNAAIAKTSGSADVILIGDQTANIVVGTLLTLTTGDADDGVYTVTAVSYDGGAVQTTVTLSASMTVSATATGVFQTNISKTYKFCYTDLIPNLDITLSHSCFAGVFKTVDNTQYGTSVIATRDHRLMFPTYSNGNPVAADVVDSDVLTNKIIQVSNLWTGAWRSSISATGSYIQVDGLAVSWSISGVDSQDVECLDAASDARNCLAKMLISYQTQCSSGTINNDLTCALISANTYYMTMQMFLSVGDTNNANLNAISIISIANSYGCGCSLSGSDTEPTRVIAGTDIASLLPSSALTTIGDMLIRNAENADSRLPIGTEGQSLTVVGGLPVWTSLLPWTTAGDILIKDAANASSRLPIGTQYFQLTSIGTVVAYSKPQGDVLLNSSAEITGVVPTYTLLANYTTEDFEGIEIKFNVKNTTTGDITFSVSGSPITISGLAASLHEVTLRIYREGTDWKIYLTAMDWRNTISYVNSTTANAVAALAFDQALVITNTLLLAGTVTSNNYVVKYLKLKKLAV